MIMPKNYTLQNASNLGWLFYKDYYRQEPFWYTVATKNHLSGFNNR